MLNKFSIQQKVRIGFGFSLLLLLIVSILSIASISTLNRNNKEVNHTHEVMTALDRLYIYMLDAETGARGYVITKEIRYLKPYYNSVKNIDASFRKLDSLTKQNSSQTERFNKLKELCRQKYALLDAGIKNNRNRNDAAIGTMIRQGTGIYVMDRIRSKIHEMKTQQNLIRLKKVRNTRLSEVSSYIIILFGNIIALTMALIAMYNINAELKQRQIIENELSNKNTSLNLLNSELEAFSYTISHDLRSPLRAIDGFSQMLIEDYADKLDAEGNRIIDIIRNNTSKMGTLIDDLLQFSRLSRLSLSVYPLNMNDIVREVLEDIQQSNPEYKAQVDINNLYHCEGDKALLKQVWSNLLSNAFKYSSKKESPVIKIESVNEGNSILYSVTDNGAGFDQKYQNKLFGIFQRLHTGKDFEGNGVGLAIVQRIIHRHGGEVFAKSNLNMGASFGFRIPKQNNFKN